MLVGYFRMKPERCQKLILWTGLKYSSNFLVVNNWSKTGLETEIVLVCSSPASDGVKVQLL